uniref:RNA polymerase II-associated factor 1 homolog n=1 Tax=Globisporangium ultimum (strain ATCC 200006 / CBS 805.95 / DAOM BR144) TaxID=431595 RepID=K3W793_GLOUD
MADVSTAAAAPPHEASGSRASGSASRTEGKPGSSSGSSSMSSADRAAREEAKRRRAPPGSNATPEERAKYELERKKIAKYKEDKLKARRDHTRMILENHAQAKRRALLGKQSEFLANLEFRNALPDLPFDTKFLQYPHENERLIKYKPNTLEADYTYEIHEEANLGLNIDLIDPAKYEAPTVPVKLEIGDEQALMMKEETNKAGKTKARPAVSWLRRTEYMGTDLYDAVHKFKSEVEIQSALREGTENALAEVVQITLEQRAEASFKDINNPATLVHPFNKKLKIAKVWDVLPDQLLSSNKYAILSYDILPSTDIKSKNIKDREARALLSGVSKKSQGGDYIQGSILLPNASNEEEHKEQEEKEVEKFAYFREYLMSVESLESNETQHSVFMFDPESDQFTYSDILHRIQLKKTKLNGEDKRRRGAIVHRREYSEAETDRRQSMLLEYGGLYDEILDDEEHIREFKRRRAGEKSAASAKSPREKTSAAEEEETKSGNESENNSEKPAEGEEKQAAADGNESPAISDGSSGSDSDSE